MTIEKSEVARMIVTVSQGCADGYKRNISQFNTEHENDVAEKCSIAASNTGWFLLQALGYSSEEIRAFVAGNPIDRLNQINANQAGSQIAPASFD